ncbi:MAG TPA: DUF4390 domain-containing protein [Thermoanaerobaculia bacterium]|nr:DUF4390 domain-containing protein [Thermoanaerobaculia bacterium]
MSLSNIAARRNGWMAPPRRARLALRSEWLVLLGWLLLAPAARAEAKISGFQAALDGKQVLVSLALNSAFNRRFVARLDSGLPTAILYRFELYRDGRHWWERRLKANTFEVVAIYDAVGRVYTVFSRLDDKLIESRTVHDRQALEGAMTRIERLPVFTLADTEHRRLLLRVRAELGSRTRLSFIPVTITTDWVESNRIRPPAPQR